MTGKSIDYLVFALFGSLEEVVFGMLFYNVLVYPQIKNFLTFCWILQFKAEESVN